MRFFILRCVLGKIRCRVAGDAMALVGPGAQIDQFAAFAAKGAKWIFRFPLGEFFTGRTFYGFGAHLIFIVSQGLNGQFKILFQSSVLHNAQQLI